MDRLPVKPTWRKPAGIFLILLLIAVWAFLVVTVADVLPPLPWPVKALFFVATGIIWILPLKPLLRWMELGRWRE
jgi:predicted membrane channel-forming protein YqfA (hemolysin III family)